MLTTFSLQYFFNTLFIINLNLLEIKKLSKSGYLFNESHF